MHSHREVLVLIGLMFLFSILTGCGSDDTTGPDTDPAKAAERVAQANQIFYPRLGVLVMTGGSDTTAFNLTSANSLYREAMTHDPSNRDARVGVALTGVLSLFADAELRNMMMSGGSVPAASVVIPKLGNGDNAPWYSHLQNSSNVLEKFIPRGPYLNELPLQWIRGDESRQPSYYQDIVERKMLPALADAIGHLEFVVQDPNYYFYITPQQIGGDIGDSIRIDLTEVYLFLAVFRTLDAFGSAGTAYNIDFDPSTAAGVQAAWSVSSPFLTFRTGGEQRMKNVKTSFLGMASAIKSGIDYLRHETTHPGVDLIRYRPQDEAGLVEIMNSMDSIRIALTTPTVLVGDFNDNGEPDELVMNIGSLFDNPIANFKAKLPAYTSDAEANPHGGFNPVLVWQAGSFSAWTFPDATFNGFLPGMTDGTLKATFGITQQDWKPRVVLGGD